MPKVTLGYIPRKPDFMNPNIEKEEQGFDKSDKFVGQKVLQENRTNGRTSGTGATFLYQGSKRQKERFVQPTTIRNYFTYYCYEVYQYCGVNTPKYRYGEKIFSERRLYDEPGEDEAGFAIVSTLIPADKISVRALMHPKLMPDQRDKGAWEGGHKLELKADQMIYNFEKGSIPHPRKVSGNLFGAHFLGYLIQNWDMGHFNGYFIERQNREHYIVIDMDRAQFSRVSESPELLNILINNKTGKSFDYLATDDQRLAVVSKIDSLLKGDLEKIYFSPRAINMFLALQPAIAMDLLAKNVYRGDVGEDFNDFKKEIVRIVADTPKTKEGIIKLCQTIREKIDELITKEGRTPNLTLLNDPQYSPDLQIECIRKNGQEILAKTAADPKILDDFRVREDKRRDVADKVVRSLEIESPEAEAITEFIIEDLRGTYYDQYKESDNLTQKLIDDISRELNIQSPHNPHKLK